MDNIDLDLLKYCSERANWFDLERAITPNMCLEESWQLFRDFGAFFKEYPNQDCISQDFKLWLRVTGHPSWDSAKQAQYSHLVQTVLDREPPKREIFLENIFGLKSQIFFSDLSSELKAGKCTIQDAEERCLAFVRSGPTSNVVEPSRLDIVQLMKEQQKSGLYWRLEDLNKSIGPLRKGDFVVIGKRPEVGGTSLTLSELTHMFEQSDGDAVFFNNEEAELKVYKRIMHAALGISEREIAADPAAAARRLLCGRYSRMDQHRPQEH